MNCPKCGIILEKYHSLQQRISETGQTEVNAGTAPIEAEGQTEAMVFLKLLLSAGYSI